MFNIKIIFLLLALCVYVKNGKTASLNYINALDQNTQEKIGMRYVLPPNVSNSEAIGASKESCFFLKGKIDSIIAETVSSIVEHKLTKKIHHKITPLEIKQQKAVLIQFEGSKIDFPDEMIIWHQASVSDEINYFCPVSFSLSFENTDFFIKNLQIDPLLAPPSIPKTELAKTPKVRFIPELKRIDNDYILPPGPSIVTIEVENQFPNCSECPIGFSRNKSEDQSWLHNKKITYQLNVQKKENSQRFSIEVT